jgi:hypothetical protein
LEGKGQLTLSDNGKNVVFAGDASATLTNVDNTISGAGQLGDGQMTLVNEGTIDATGTNALVVDTGSKVITNSGILEATGTGGLIVNSAVANTGSLLADGGNLTFNGAVTGNGTATISGAVTLEFAAASAETISFAAGSTGTLKLDDSASFTGSVSGLTTTTYIELADLPWAQGQMTATFSGNTSGGKLTVSDGTGSDTINLVGDYTQSSWNLSQGSNGDTLVVDPPLSSVGNMPQSTAGNMTAFPAPTAVLSHIDPPADMLVASPTAIFSHIDSPASMLVATPSDSGNVDRSTALLTQYAAAGFQSGPGGGAGGFITTPTQETTFGEAPHLTKPTT